MYTLNEYFDEYFQNFRVEIINRHYFMRSAAIAIIAYTNILCHIIDLVSRVGRKNQNP
jgi:hypothetical protein